MVANQTECSRFEQRSVIKFLVAEKCKTWEIYRSVFDVYEEACFNKNIYANWLNMGFLQQARVEKQFMK